jgi:DNA-binding NarL/FixJ family response regulator
MTTVLIVDDHRDFRARARRLLEGAGFAIVGEASDGASALTAVAELQPDAVLLDVQLPDASGFEISEALALAPGAPAVVLVSSRDAADYGRKVDRCGARGFIPKAELSGRRFATLVERHG